MCRYAMHSAKSHYACLDCRYAAKHPWHSGPLCRGCRAPMVEMGRDFKAPRKQATAQWEKLRLLVDAGFTFDSCGCGGPGWRPSTLAEAKTALHQRRSDRKHPTRPLRKVWRRGRELLDA